MLISLRKVEFGRIKSLLQASEIDISTARILISHLKKDSYGWSSVYKLYYDALHELAEAYLLLEKTKSENHQCLFAYLCQKHPELELSWDFFEKVRTKRNGIKYYGESITHLSWKEVELQFNLYLNSLKQKTEKELK